jgi:glycosyltransferase involved in cell wall biosynthesis
VKILHVIPSVSPIHGGPSTVIRIMTEALARAGHDVHLATTDDDGLTRMTVPLGQAQMENGVSCWYFARNTRAYRTSIGLTTWLSRNLKSFDVVHTHALFSYVALPTAILARRHRVPNVVRPLGVLNRWGVENRRPLLKKLSYQFIERKIIASAALMHYTSKLEQVEARALGANTRSIVVPNPIVFPESVPEATIAEFTKRFPAIRGKRIILFLSRFDAKKGLDLLLKAFSIIAPAYPDVVLMLAGSGSSEMDASLHQQARDQMIADRIIWPGFLNGAAKWAAFRASEMFVLPSYSENFSVAAAEAMASGLPVIVSDNVGLHPDVLESGGGYVTACDAYEVAAAIEQLLSNPDRARAMGAAGRKLALSRYSVTAVTGEIERAYARVIS